MKILLSLSYYTPNISGITVYVECLAQELVRKGHEVTVVASQHSSGLPKSEKKNGVKIHRIPVTFQLGKGAIMMSFPWHILKLMRQTEVVNCHLPQFESAIVALLAKIMRKKIILTYHCDLSFKGVGPYLVVALVYLSQLVAAILADTVVVYTKDYASHSWFLRLFQKKQVQVYPPVVMPPESGRKDLQFSNKTTNIGFVGRIAHEKGLSYLLSAIPLLQKKLQKPFKLWLIGPTTEIIGEYYLDQLKALLDRYKKYITITGKVPHANLGDYYKNLDVLVLPSDDSLEAFGIVQVEAMLMGVPVVATDLPGVRVPIQETGMGVVIPSRDPEAIAGAIIKIMNDKKKYIKPSEKIRTLFNLENVTQRYEQIYSSKLSF